MFWRHLFILINISFIFFSYFDCTRMLVVDPMHNLFLGTAKRMIRLWTDEGLLSNKQLQCIQQTVDGMQGPPDIGRIPRIIEPDSQHLLLTLYYSIPALHGLLDDNLLECWRRFVLACLRLCKKSISVENITALLLQFCQCIERIYGTTAVQTCICIAT